MNFLNANIFEKIFNIINWANNKKNSFKDNEWTHYDAILKYYEEFGELSEAILIISEKLPHKSLNEEPTGEIADNINQISDIISFNNYFLINYKDNINPDMSFKSFFNRFEKDLEFKYNNNIKNALYSIHKDYAKTKELIVNNEEQFLITYFEDAIRQLILINYLLLNLKNKKNNISYNDFISSINILLDFIDEKFKKWQNIEENKIKK